MSDSLTVNGTLYNLSDEAGLNSLAADVQAMPDNEPLVIEDAAVFRPGWNRKGFAPHPKQLAKYAKSSKGTPILYYHDPAHLMGASKSMRYDKDRGLLQSMTFDDPLMKRMLALKIMPRFSIGWLPSENTKLECSSCHKPLMDTLDRWFGAEPKEGECPHYIGQELEDGTKVQGLWTDVEHAETSVLFHPASTGTGLSAPDDELTALSERIKIYKTRRHMDTKEKTPAPETATLSAPDTTLADITAERDRLGAEIAKWDEKYKLALTEIDTLTARVAEADKSLSAYRTAERQTKVRAYRERKALQGSESDILAMYEQIGPEAFDKLMAAVPDSQLAHVVTGIQPPAPHEITDGESLRLAALQMERDTQGKVSYSQALITLSQKETK